MRRTAALIVGGGPAGSAAAIALARAGARPELIERTTGDRDVVCGGFIGWDALARLRRLGVDPEALGARPIRRVRLVAGTRAIQADLPHLAAGLSRRRLDAALLAAAERAGTQVTRGRSARAVEDGLLRLDDGGEIAAEAFFLATGKHELRGVARDLGRRREAPAAGLRTVLSPRPDLEQALAETIELHFYDGGYAGLLLQEDGSANVCLSIARARLAAAGSPEALVSQLMHEAPILAGRLGGVVPHSWEAVAGIPYGWRARETVPGLFRLGDQAAVIASLAGDGIAVAVASGEAAAWAFIEGGPAASAAYQRRFARRAHWPVRIGEWLRHSGERRVTRNIIARLLPFFPGAADLAAQLTRIG